MSWEPRKLLLPLRTNEPGKNESRRVVGQVQRELRLLLLYVKRGMLQFTSRDGVGFDSGIRVSDLHFIREFIVINISMDCEYPRSQGCL